MSAIFDALFNSILPIFAVSVLGFFFARLKWFSADMAATLNKFVIFVGLPALLFSFLATAPFEAFNWALIAIYLAASVSIYALGFALMRFLFGLGLRESVLLGMAACFSNHVFFVFYIAENLYGDVSALPIVSIITLDAFIVFGGTYLWMDIAASKARSVLAALKVFLKNPMIIALLVGLPVGILNLPVPQGLLTYAKFTGGAAAPLSMFALGVILSGTRLSAFDPAAFTVAGLKLFAHPFIVFCLIYLVLDSVALGRENIWASIVLFTAAGPCGAMPFAIALQHGVKTERIVKTLVYSTVFSLLTLAILSSI